ncbi:hypothetical protein MSG37_12000 [Shewanella sp. 1CM18E]|nr:hypothetical protein [Shewanella sp. 1CM18E]MCK8045606.1 hypothetical protein [Shewanella sp. 1CM18E]
MMMNNETKLGSQHLAVKLKSVCKANVKPKLLSYDINIHSTRIGSYIQSR